MVDFVAVLHGLVPQPGMEARPQQETLAGDAVVNNWDPGVPWGLDSPSEFFVEKQNNKAQSGGGFDSCGP